MNYTVDSASFHEYPQSLLLQLAELCIFHLRRQRFPDSDSRQDPTFPLWSAPPLCYQRVPASPAAGVYVPLFISAISHLSRRAAGQLPLFIVTWTMLAFGTAHAIIEVSRTTNFVHIFQQAIQNYYMDATGSYVFAFNALTEAEDILFSINNMLTDLFLLYRCYVIWGSVRVTILPGLLILSTFLTALIQSLNHIQASPLLAEMLLYEVRAVESTHNVAGRIWWMKREVSCLDAVPTNIFRKRYTKAIEIIVDSAALYCLLSIVLAATSSYTEGPGMLVHNILYSAGTQAANIIPTLAIVRGIRERDEDSKSTNRTATPSPKRAAMPSNRVFNVSEVMDIGKMQESV
ncbi:hypothetical protein FB45DRAFT_1068455 [Roridomyces roridus]|uniref:Uncharacterized protein n=1 Tax=Roridomyces roridus TaxID=1738132 RepID=A0AAD7F751_9AGAR|nr:hypothetical protein FB45DRAFT_1068455 [Roridomyces roridus]